MILLVNLCILFKTTWICIIIIAIQWNKCIHTMGINFRIANLSLNFFSVKYFSVSMTPNWWNTEGQSKNKTKKKLKTWSENLKCTQTTHLSLYYQSWAASLQLPSQTPVLSPLFSIKSNFKPHGWLFGMFWKLCDLFVFPHMFTLTRPMTICKM